MADRRAAQWAWHPVRVQHQRKPVEDRGVVRARRRHSRHLLPPPGGSGKDVHALGSTAGFHFRTHHHYESARHRCDEHCHPAVTAQVAHQRLPFGWRRGARAWAQQERIGEFFRAAAPYRLIFAGNLALAVPQPGHSNLPLELRRGTDNLWYVDEAKAWTYFHRF